MTVYVTGDIHGGVDMQKLRDWELGDSLTSDDYLIVAGDFGFPWDFSAEECADIAWLESRPYTLLFVDGNHERFDHWAERPMELWHGGLTQRLSDTSPIRRLTRGEVFELDGSTIFTMGGATSVDKEYRMAIARNHTATHLLQAALREVLGDHVHQAGSYQDASITHFDFTHFSAVTPEELARVQKIVNDKIFDSMNVTVQELSLIHI